MRGTPPPDPAVTGQRRRLLFGLILAIFVAINVSLAVLIAHVFHAPGYLRTGHLRYLLVPALILNILACGLLLLFRWSAQWRYNLKILLIAQCFVALLPFVLGRVLRIPGPYFRQHAFGLAYALFVYLHLSVLLVYGFLHIRNGGERSRSATAPHLWVFAVSLLIYGAITPWMDVACRPTADEPHYLLLTHSLVFDHDFDLANNYAHGDYKRFYPPNIPRPDHHTVVNARRQEVPVHDVGISILLVPGYALAGRLGAMLELNVFGAFLALGIFVLGRMLGASPRAALAAWVLFAFTSPVVVYASQVYPEVLAAGIIVWSLAAHVRFSESLRWPYLLAAASGLALLPWLSARYWLIFAPMMAVIALYLLLGRAVPRAVVSKRLALLFAPSAFSLAAFAAFDWHWYQTLIPNAGYVLLLRPRPSLFTPHLLPGLPGLLFDRAFGLLATAPVYLLAMAGAWVLCRRKPWQGAAVVLPVVAYVLLAALNKFWYGGWAPPPRYIVTGVVMLAPLAALVISRRAPRVLLAILAGWSFFVAVAYTAFPLARYTSWKVVSSALSDFLAPTIGFHFDAAFPSLIRAAGKDYLLCGFWAIAALTCMWGVLQSVSENQKFAQSSRNKPQAVSSC